MNAPGTPTQWQGFDAREFQLEGRPCLVVCPKRVARGRPWIWRTQFFGHEPQSDIALLHKGYHAAWTDLNDMLGGPEGLARMDAFHAFCTAAFGLSAQPVLSAFSRGGLEAYNWASLHPDKVACIYADAPVCDIRSWPGGRGTGHGAPREWELCKSIYRLTEESASDFRGNPIDRLEPLARAGIGLLHVCGDADEAVPMPENTGVLADRYRALGGDITVIAKPGCLHHPHSLKDPHRIVTWILQHTPGQASKAAPRAYHTHLPEGLANVRVRIERDRFARVAFLGGSITESPDGWRDDLCRRLRQRFPDATFDFVNAGISSIDSTGDAFRFSRDVLAAGRIDLLFVDASVNDHHNKRSALERIRGMEGIVWQARLANPAVDIVFLCFIDAAYLPILAAGRTPPVIASHLKVAKHYNLASLNLAREVADRIADGEFPWEAFRDCHPSPFGHALYAASIDGLFEAACRHPLPPGAQADPHPLPAPIDPHSYTRARLVDIRQARLGAGWSLVEAWRPADQTGTRAGFVDVPALVAETPGAELTFSFTGSAVGLFVAAGPDAGILEFRVDKGRPRRFDLFTPWSSWLHLPWACLLAGDLRLAPHTLTLRLTGDRHPDSKGTAARIMHLLVN